MSEVVVEGEQVPQLTVPLQLQSSNNSFISISAAKILQGLFFLVDVDI